MNLGLGNPLLTGVAAGGTRERLTCMRLFRRGSLIEWGCFHCLQQFVWPNDLLNRRMRNRTSGGVGGRGPRGPLLPDSTRMSTWDQFR
jgi:hypothetical protein